MYSPKRYIKGYEILNKLANVNSEIFNFEQNREILFRNISKLNGVIGILYTATSTVFILLFILVCIQWHLLTFFPLLMCNRIRCFPQMCISIRWFPNCLFKQRASNSKSQVTHACSHGARVKPYQWGGTWLCQVPQPCCPSCTVTAIFCTVFVAVWQRIPRLHSQTMA